MTGRHWTADETVTTAHHTVQRRSVPEDRDVDDEALRLRFPWIGLVDDDWGDVATRYRQIMSEALVNRRTVEAIKAVRQDV